MFSKIKLILVLIIIFSSSFSLFSQNKSRKYRLEGNQAYEKKNYDEAAANYLRAIQEGDNSYKSNFNLGNALFKLQKYQDAVQQYEKSIKFTENKIEKSRAYFNIGDAYYQKKQYQKAADSFKQALKLNPMDERARYNYALAKQKLKKEKEKQGEKNTGEGQNNQTQKDPKSSPNQQENQTQNPSQPPTADKPNQQGQSGGFQNDQKGQGNGKQDQGEKERDNYASPEKEEILETAQNQEFYNGILGAMQEQEKRAQQKIINKRVSQPTSKKEKDW